MSQPPVMVKLVRRESIDPLTGFRFIAAMMVFFSHYTIPGLTGTALRMTQSGYAGVTLFFVLSGFVIAYNYLDRFETGMTVRNVGEYFAARFARVYPLYVGFILIGWLIHGYDGVPWVHLMALQTWGPDLDLAFALNGPAWSIGVEVFLYLAFPLLVPLIIRSGGLTSLRRVQIAAALVSLAMVGGAAYVAWSGLNDLPFKDPASGHRWLYRMPVTRVGDFLLGIFGAVYFTRFASSDETNVRRWGHVTLLAAIVLLVFLATRKNYRSAFGWDVAYALPTVLMIIGLAINQRTVISRALSSPALILLGEASYALYLVHAPAGAIQFWNGRGLPGDLALYAVFVVMVICLSIGLHIAIEKPARNWVRRWLAPGTKIAAIPQEPDAIRPKVTK